MSDFIPTPTFVPYTGVVEDNVDPLGLGRVRVRAHGYHSPSTADIPTEDLPWAHVGVTSSETMYSLEIGEWVFGYFLDADEKQQMVVIAALPGLNSEDEPTTSRWYRNEKTDETTTYDNKDNIISHGNIEEPSSPYAAEHPENNVIETKSGHLIELDDTSGAERIHVYHKSGSFEEYHPDGSKVERTEVDNYKATRGNVYTVTLGNVESSTKGNETTRTDGSIERTLGTTFLVESDTGAAVEFDTSGLISVRNNTTDLKTVLQELISILQKFQTNGDPSTHVTGPGTQAELANLLTTKILTLFK